MKTTRITLIAGAMTALAVSIQAQPSAHYVPGSEGLKGSTLPPPGFYFKDYNYFYWADQLNDATGHKSGPPNFEAFTYANIPRAIWITDVKVLGGYLGVDGLLPLVDQHVRAGGFDNTTAGIGDLYGEGTLSWHTKQFDFALASGVWAPTGDSAPQPTTRIGAGFWTFMQTAGATWYVDESKTWAVSALNRLEFNTEQRDVHVTPGDAWTLEWGISKSVCKEADIGVVGYYQRQVTADSDKSSALNSVAAVGPEISVMFPKPMIFASLRYNYEFMAKNRAQGNAVTLTITRAF